MTSLKSPEGRKLLSIKLSTFREKESNVWFLISNIFQQIQRQQVRQSVDDIDQFIAEAVGQPPQEQQQQIGMKQMHYYVYPNQAPTPSTSGAPTPSTSGAALPIIVTPYRQVGYTVRGDDGKTNTFTILVPNDMDLKLVSNQKTLINALLNQISGEKNFNILEQRSAPGGFLYVTVCIIERGTKCTHRQDFCYCRGKKVTLKIFLGRD